MPDISLTVNGATRTGSPEARKTLADFLRDDLSLTGTHLGCEHGVCGACTVILDGRAVRSCLMLAVQAAGSDVTTIEGLGPDGEMGTLQQAMWDSHSFQCGFCTPGMVMQAAAFLSDHPDADEQQVREALSGNICRCTGYQSIMDGVLLAAERIREERSCRQLRPSGIPAPASSGRRTRASSPARAGTSTTSSCRGCCTPRSCARRWRTPGCSRSTSRPRGSCPGSSRRTPGRSWKR